jgi:hypothetical protein
MLATRRENISDVPGHQVWRRSVSLLLTPRAVREQMKKEKRLRLTKLDQMVTAEEASALERWALNEQALSGRAKTQSWDNGGGGSMGDASPIPDAWMARVNWHSRIKLGLDDETREILAAFTATQNRELGALSSAQYGLTYRPDARNKSQAFLEAIVECATALVKMRY